MSANILLIEDDIRLSRLISSFLKNHGFHVRSATHGNQGLFQCQSSHIDLVILDVNLPDITGYEVCNTLKMSNFPGKVLMLTTNQRDQDELQGLQVGADDYVTKPSSPEILLARINLLLGRQQPTASILTYGDLTIILTERKVLLADHEVSLTNREFDILVCLAQQVDSIVSRDTISRRIRGVDYDGIDRSIDLTISRLRGKLNVSKDYPNGLQTMHGKGYLLSSRGWQT